MFDLFAAGEKKQNISNGRTLLVAPPPYISPKFVDGTFDVTSVATENCFTTHQNFGGCGLLMGVQLSTVLGVLALACLLACLSYRTLLY